MSHLEGLNEEQYRAVTHTNGPLLVVAGAGTGKTKTIVHRILNLISQGVVPSSILAITFTNKAAHEMKDRLVKSLGALDSFPRVSTFHSLGVLLLRENALLLGVTRNFTILDADDAKALIRDAMKELDIDPKLWDPSRIANIISRSKGEQHTPDTFHTASTAETSIVQPLWRRYEELKRSAHAFDFDDLLVQSYRLLKDNPSVLARYQQQWRYVHVDEYQDTNRIQYEIVKLLVKEHRNLCAVGDGDQNIYSWRGADIRNILHFEKDFPDATVVLLEKNYRSTGTILKVAHEIISKNTERIEKVLHPHKEEGSLVILYEAFSGHQEASWVANRVSEYLSGGTNPREIAVLFRTNFQSRLLEEAFLFEGIPYQVVGVRFFARKEVKDVMSYLKAAINPASLGDIKRVINEPKRGLGKVAIAKIFAGRVSELNPKSQASYASFTRSLDSIREASLQQKPSEIIRHIIEVSGLKQSLHRGGDDGLERLANIQELVSYATKYDDFPDGLDRFLEEVALLSDQDSLGNTDTVRDTVKLMTIHASKGLEFRYVFVVGLEQGLFPSLRDGEKSKHEQEEERRLCYVAFTRAKDRLHLSYAQLRTIYGEQRMNEPSEFLRDIPEELIERSEEDAEATVYL